MTMKFSQRIGHVPAQKLAQREGVDIDLRNSLWSVIDDCCLFNYESPRLSTNDRQYVRKSNMGPLVESLWLYHFKMPLDTIPEFWSEFVKVLRKQFFACEWYEAYDLVEFIAQNQPSHLTSDFIKFTNSFLLIENSAYRFVGESFAEITSEIEIDAVSTILDADLVSEFTPVKTHLKQALVHLSHRTQPDYRNSIKESISAVEALVKIILSDKKGTLGQLLTRLEKERKLHPALKSSLSSLYGYTSDECGIRHALTESREVSHSDAKLMLVTCSAFVSYLIEDASL